MKKSLIIILLSVCSCTLDAQRIMKKPDSREIIVNRNDTVIEANVFIGQVKRKPDTGRTYFWYANGEINSNTGGYRGMLLDGNYNEIVDNKLTISGSFRKGAKAGTWKKWNTSGRLLEVSNWSKGKLAGKHYIYDETGSIRETITHRKKLPPGKSDDNIQGSPVLQKIFHKKSREYSDTTEIVSNRKP